MFNPAEASDKIKEEFIDYISTSFSIADEEYFNLFRSRLQESGVISKGPYIDINDIFKGGHSIAELSSPQVNILSPLFSELEKRKPNDSKHKHKLPLTRPLYLHQENAIKVITVNKANAVITTGTGSGKTECFLIPILNEILREKEAKGNITPGVRALLIYPMNALANDQMKRLREILMYYPDITFGVYNGDTERKEDDAKAKYVDLHANESCEELREPLDNELLSREVMNATPPHILCTNYAMLEHMMLRPENDKIFANSDFKFVVLDEAHIYFGATGMETALLLRRLKARISTSTKTRFILTSATLGEKGRSEADIIRFAENLSGEHFDENSIVYGQREPFTSVGTTNDVPIQVFEELVDSAEENYANCFARYGISYNSNESPAANLYNLCLGNTFYYRLRTEFHSPSDIATLADILGTTKKQAIAFIHICTLAEKNGKALIDAKYHFFIKALEGAYSTLYGPKELFLSRKNVLRIGDEQISCFERAVCPNCGELGIVGKVEKQGKLDKIVLAPQYDDDIKFLHILDENEGVFEEFDFEDNEDFGDEEAPIKDKSYQEYYLCPKCGAITEKDDGLPRCGCKCTPIRVAEYINSNGKCPKCQVGNYRRFYIGAEAATGVLATSLFEELPRKTITDYGADGATYEFDGGKQFLAFSDSRSEAAFFASYLDKSYKEFLRRRGLVTVLSELKDEILEEPLPVSDLAEELTKLFANRQSFKNDLTEVLTRRELKQISLRNAWMAILTELVYARRRTSLVSLGKIKFEYCGNNDKIVTALSTKYNLNKNQCKELLDYLAMSFAYFGALKIDDDIIDADERKYIFYTDKQKIVVLQKTASTDRYSMSWKARNREGKIDSYYPNSRVRLVARVLNADEKIANEFLEDYFSGWLIRNENKYHLEKGNGNFFFMPAENYQIRIYGDENAHWYRCKKCGKISTYNIDGKCLENRCDGDLEEIDPTLIGSNNHYLTMYSKPDLTSLLIREHTAQLSREEGLKYQTDFEKNHIHALSCSTTFEMGVDVGELETVFLRNVPPTAANYAQRAGRAGRSKNSAAYSLTYAKLSSHDFNYFNEPDKIIVGKIKPPVFKTDNRKIVLRHIYAVVLSFFFKHNPEYFNYNKATEFLDNGGYERLVGLLETQSKARDELYELLNRSIPNVNDYNWQEEFIGENGILKNAVMEYQETVEKLQGVIDENSIALQSCKEQSERTKILDRLNKTDRSLKKYQAKELIDFLVRNNILPKYGFPIDTVELEVNSDDRVRQDLQLSRDLKMAISEYAPGEKVIANNKMYTSRYIKKSFFNGRMDYYTSYVCQCDCGTWNYSENDPRDSKEQIKCVACHTPILLGKWNMAIEPRGGFSSEQRVEEVPMSRPDKIYHSQDSYIGNGKRIDEYHYQVNGRTIILKSSENDSIMVTSHTKFYVCKNCGYTYGFHDVIRDDKGKKDKQAVDSIKKNAPFIIVSKKHRNGYDHLCNNNKFYPYVLNHIYKTDVVVLDFLEYNDDEETMLSVMYAVLNAMSSTLGIDRNDIGGCLKANYNKSKSQLEYSIVLYDTVAGGAGHVRRLLSPQALENIFATAYTAMNDCKCDTSCYNCLRGYFNQRVHEKLDRHLALKFLGGFIGSISESEHHNEIQTQKKRLLLAKDGLKVSTEAYDYIFSLLDDDLETALADLFSVNDLKKPDLNDVSFDCGNEKGYANLAWVNQKILMFTQDNIDSYNKALQSDYTCILLNADFDLNELINLLKH